MSGKAFLDTNVLVYLFDCDEPVKRGIAREILEAGSPGELVLSSQVLSEFYVTATRKLARTLSSDQAAQAIGWLGLLPVVSIDLTLVKQAIEIGSSAQISYWDSLIIAAAANADCERLITEDLNHGQEIGSVRIENPFRGVL